MIGKLKHNSIQKEYNKLIEKQSSKTPNQQKVKTIAILLDNESLINVIEANLTNKLPFKKENITFLVYKEQVKKGEENDRFFTEDAIGFKGSLKSDNIKNFVKKDYDLLINYTKESNLYTNVITLYSRAKFKTGFANIDDRLFDLIVADDTYNEAVLNQELKKYLTILKKV